MAQYLPHLLSEGRINTMVLRNRLAVPAMGDTISAGYTEGAMRRANIVERIGWPEYRANFRCGFLRISVGQGWA